MRKLLTWMVASLFALAIMVIPFSTSLGETETTLVDFSDFPSYDSDTKDFYSVICADMFFALYGSEGDAVSFEGYIDYYDTETVKINNGFTAKDVLRICPGDFSDKTEATWGFVIENMIEEPTSYYDYSLQCGDNVLVSAIIKGRSDDNMVMLEQAHIERRSANKAQSEIVVNKDSEAIVNEDVDENDASFAEEFSEILKLENPRDELVRQFASRYNGETVEFDGFIYRCDDVWPDKYDITIYAGDYAEAVSNGTRGAIFQINDIAAKELGFDGNDFPANFGYGSDIHVKAQIVGYDNPYDFIIIDPYLIEIRIPLLEGLDASIYAELSRGSKGESVKELQQRLIDLKYLIGKADGSYGKKTAEAVEKFQNSCKLDATGVADATTQAILFSEKAPEAKLTVSCSSVVVGSSAKTVWYVDGQEFTLTGNKTKTIKTVWGTYKFDAYGKYEKIEE